MQNIILASQSPRRKQLLEWAEIDFEVVISDCDESWPAGMQTDCIPVHIAGLKAAAVKRLHPGKIIIAADTLVILQNDVIGKPKHRNDAIEILTKLSGTMHRVVTGVVITSDHKQVEFADVTEVQFHTLIEREIEYYVDRYRPYDKAGAYAIQEWIGVIGIKSIRGDFYNVMGLPVSRVVQALSQW